MQKLVLLMSLLALSMSASACAFGAGAAAGAIGADEANENDGEFDPLEEGYDGDPSTAGPVDREGKK